MALVVLVVLLVPSGVTPFLFNQKHKVLSPGLLYYHRCRWFGVTRGSGSINTLHPHGRLPPHRQTSLHPSSLPLSFPPSLSLCFTAQLDLPQLLDGQMFCSSGETYLGSHGPLRLQLLLQVLDACLQQQREEQTR